MPIIRHLFNVYDTLSRTRVLYSLLSTMTSEPQKPVNTDKPAEHSWRVNYITGDLFACAPDESMAHCISEDIRMSKGIAVKFKNMFKGVDDLWNQYKLAGQCAVLKREQRFVYYLITKKKAGEKPTYGDLEGSLKDMKVHCLANGVTRISMPRIGCGLDQLQWERVEEILEQVFRDTNISITVYSVPETAEATVAAYSHGVMSPSPGQPAEDRWRVNYITGDLFACAADESMAHCISEDIRMSKGIAVKFKNMFKGVDDLWNQYKLAGQCAVLKREQRFVYYLITKKKAGEKPTYGDLEGSLREMKVHCLENGVTRISMPRIGCGLDQLQWERVEEILEQVFRDTNISITVYSVPETAEATVTKEKRRR